MRATSVLWASAALALACAACGASAPGRASRLAPGAIYAAPAAGGALESVVCPNGTTCWAVGHTGADLGGGSLPVIERYNPSGWYLARSPSTAGHSAALHGVACADQSDCWAVGAAVVGGRLQPLVERFSNAAWSIFTAVAATGVGGVLRSVTCVSLTHCWAVGSLGTPTARTLIERFDGAAWTTVTSPDPAGAHSAALGGVTCQGAGDCWAVGGDSDGHALAEHYDGGTWSITSPPATSTTEADALAGVACTSGGSCWAVGSSTRGSSHAPLVEQYTAGAWGVVPSPTTLFGGRSSLSAVTCFTDANCWAVGSSRAASGADLTLVEQYDGEVWKVVYGPALGLETSTALQGVMCPSDDDCWTVGRCTAPSTVMCAGSASLIELYDTILPDGH